MRLIYYRSDVSDGIVTYKFAAFASQEDNDIRLSYVQDFSEVASFDFSPLLTCLD
jgi:hypothetical protein